MKLSAFRTVLLTMSVLITISNQCLTAGTEAMPQPSEDRAPKPLRIMSFNIRYGTANDGENHWMNRRDFVVQTIQQFAPDLLGTQETLAFQKDYLKEQLPDFEAIGVGRVDGQQDGEMMAVFYRKSRFEKIAEGHFWLSETPDQIGSKSWDSSLPRMVTWVTLRDLDQPGSKPIAFLNTHFDHRGSQARLESAKLLRQMIYERFADMSIIVTGDFNTEEASPPYNKLFAQLAEAEGKLPAGHSPVIDSFRAAHPQQTDHEGTFSGFNSAITTGPRIDWIGVSRDFTVISGEIDRTALNGRTPSDHFPINAVVHR